MEDPAQTACAAAKAPGSTAVGGRRVLPSATSAPTFGPYPFNPSRGWNKMTEGLGNSAIMPQEV